MRPGRETDVAIAKEIFGHRVWAQGKVLYENAERGDRPLRNYSREIEWAFEVVRRMKMTLIPIEGDHWFAFVGPTEIAGWESPTAVLKFLEGGKFEGCGAAIGNVLSVVICEAALKAAGKRVGGGVGAAPGARAEIGAGAAPGARRRGRGPRLAGARRRVRVLARGM